MGENCPVGLSRVKANKIGSRVLRPVNAGLPECHLRALANTERRKDLKRCVASVYQQRHLGVAAQRLLHMTDTCRDDLEQVQQFHSNLRVRPDDFRTRPRGALSC